MKFYGQGEHEQGLTDLVGSLIEKRFNKRGIIGHFGCGKMYFKYAQNETQNFDTLENTDNIPLYEQCDLNQRINREDNYFTNSVALELLEHLECPLCFLREISRVTQDMIIISFPRGIASGWYNPLWYEQTGHIQILEPWLIKMHINKIGCVLVDEFNLSYKNCILIFRKM